MKVKILKKFIDKKTKEIRHKGDIVEYSEERFQEIYNADRNLVEKFNEEKEEATDTEDVMCDIAQLKKKTKEELLELATQQGIEVNESMKKDELIAALSK